MKRLEIVTILFILSLVFLSFKSQAEVLSPPYNTATFFHNSQANFDDDILLVQAGAVVDGTQPDGDYNSYGFRSAAMTVAKGSGYLWIEGADILNSDDYRIPITGYSAGNYNIKLYYTLDGYVASPRMAFEPLGGGGGTQFDIGARGELLEKLSDGYYTHVAASSYDEIYKKDWSLGWAIADIAWDSVMAILKYGVSGSGYITIASDVAGVFDMAKFAVDSVDNFIPDEEFSPQQLRSVSFNVDLEQNKEYRLSFKVNNRVWSACNSSITAIQMGASDFDVKIHSIYINENSTGAPIIGRFYAAPNPVSSQSLFVLAAEASDSDGQVSLAEFYKDSNDNGQFDVSLDQRVGVDTHYNQGFSFMGYANLSAGTHRFFARVQDNSGKWSAPASTTLTVGSSPAVQGSHLSLDGTDWNADAEGDEDGVIETEEDVEFRQRLESSANITNVQGTLTSPNSSLDISDDRERYPSISAGDNAWPDGDGFNMYFNSTSTTNVPFNLHVEYAKDGKDYYQDFSFSKTFYKNGSREAGFDLISFTIDDSIARSSRNNGDGIIQSGELVDIRPKLKNTGQSGATDIDAWLTYSGTFFSVDDSDKEAYPDLDPGDEAYPIFDEDYTIRDLQRSYSGTQYIDLHLTYDQGTYEFVLPNAITLDVEPAAWLKVPEDYWDFGVEAPDSLIEHTTQIQNTGSKNLTITGITSSNADTTWTGDPLPWVLGPGASRDLDVLINTSGLQGAISREITVQSDGRMGSPGEDDKLIITGLVSDLTQTLSVPDVTGAEYPDISGSWIVWADRRNGNMDILAFDTVTGIEQQITTDIYNQWEPFISGNLIAWTDGRNNPDTKDYDVYAYDLDKPELGVFPVSIASPWKDKLLGLDNGLVAIFREYEFLVESDGDIEEVANLHVLEYDDNGGFSEVWATGYVPGSGENPRMTVEYDCDFNEGFLVFQQHEEYMYVQSDGDRTWQSRNSATYAIDFSRGDTSATKVFNDTPWLLAAAAHRFVYNSESAEGDDEIWLWRNNGSTQSIVGVVDEDAPDYVLGIGGPDGQDVVVYDWDHDFRIGMMYLDRENGDQEKAITSSDGAEELRVDGYGLVWVNYSDSKKVNYTYLKQSDIAVSPANIAFTAENGVEGEPIDVSVLVRNLSDYALTDDITVRLYAGDPDTGAAQLGVSHVIYGGIAGNGQHSLIFTSVILPAIDGSTYEEIVKLYVRITVPEYDNPENNTASANITVYDSDTEGPSISNVQVEEHSGDGDGIIGADEEIQISWKISDFSGIGSMALSVDGASVALDGNNYAILNYLGAGDHNFSINVTDADASPMSSQYDSSFNVVVSEKLTVLHNDVSVSNGATVSVGSVPVGIENATVLFEIRNDGSQTLTLENMEINIVEGSMLSSGPMDLILPEGNSTYFTITPDTSSFGLYGAGVSIANSDISGNPFTFNISGEVVKLLPGDINNDGAVDLGDAIQILQMLTGAGTVGPIYKGADVNDDLQMGLENAIYIFQKISEMP